ncbi:DsbA family oxidoreductase [Flexibacterium corallicola]|uniref:DsbA family oxidoreductase n=1 Tax=Flexibacterium corallicola TaxID=3037259 RepID=UPI00286F089D|nr:DsbA family oxidoreductase [Pseudovibrio sp. M1P-2-3]
MPATPPLTIEIVSDVMCPWCYIGKRRLETALESLPDMKVEVSWLPYQLDATLPKTGKDRQQYLEDKFGGPENARTAYAPIRQSGAEEGIAFEFDAIQKSPNTLDSHRLLHWAKEDGKQNALAEALFAAYFTHGRDLTLPETLAEIAGSCGMDPTRTLQRLMGEEDRQVIEEQIASAHQMGVSGVPFFVIDQRFALSGAQPAETLAAALRHAEETRTQEL